MSVSLNFFSVRTALKQSKTKYWVTLLCSAGIKLDKNTANRPQLLSARNQPTEHATEIPPHVLILSNDGASIATWWLLFRNFRSIAS